MKNCPICLRFDGHWPACDDYRAPEHTGPISQYVGVISDLVSASPRWWLRGYSGPMMAVRLENEGRVDMALSYDAYDRVVRAFRKNGAVRVKVTVDLEE